MAEDLAKELNSRFYILARHFWPGPLTMIVPAAAKCRSKSPAIPDAWRSGRRNRRCWTRIIEKTGHALIATSANLSGQPTIASGIELFAAMDGRVDLVLDGGLCTGPGRPPSTSPSPTGG